MGRIVIETYQDEIGNDIGELVIETDEFEFKVVHYGAVRESDKKRSPKFIKHYTSEAGALRCLLSLTLKEGKHETIEAVLAGLAEIREYIKEKTELVVASREPTVKRMKVKAEVVEQ